MSSKRIEIFKKGKKASNHFKKASNFLKISLKCHKFLKKSVVVSKKKPYGNCRIATMTSPPLVQGWIELPGELSLGS
jgi:hypothetical protein